MPNLAGRAIGEFLSGVGDSLKEEFALGKQAANNPRPLSFENLPDIGDPAGIEFSPEQAPSPVLLAALTPTLAGDVVGLGLDIEGFTSGRLEITPFNLGLSGLGLLPFIPSLGAIKRVSRTEKSSDALPFVKRTAEDVRSKTQKLLSARKELGSIKEEAGEIVARFTDIPSAKLADLSFTPAGLLDIPDDKFLELAREGLFARKLKNFKPEQALKEYKKLLVAADEQADLVDNLREISNNAMNTFIEARKTVSKAEAEELIEFMFRTSE